MKSILIIIVAIRRFATQPSLVSKMLFGAALLLSSSSSIAETSRLFSSADRIKLVDGVGEIPQRIKLPQAWDESTRSAFWFTSQGAQIIPYSWFTWLEVADSTELFRSSTHMEELRYLSVAPSELNPAGLPIGFVPATDPKTKQVWMGMTCAACHTNQLDFQGNQYLIEGAPTLGNFVLFYSRLIEALNQTSSDDEKFNRFAHRVLGDDYSAQKSKALRQAVTKVTLAAAERQSVNALPSGYADDFTSYARLDAFGNIQNAGTAFALHDLSNRNFPDAPVSYPFLWGTHQSDVVQWNASAPNTPVIGPLARNVGEVIGVFGGLSITKAPWYERIFGIKVKYSSTVDVLGLGKLESMVKTLRSPQWSQTNLPAVDNIKAGTGAVLFAENCAECHQVIAREDEGLKYTANQTPVSEIGTDPATAWNADKYMAKSLILEGTKSSILFGAPFEAETAAIGIPVNGAIGLILKHPIKALEAGLMPIKTKSSASNEAEVALSSGSQEGEPISLRSIKEHVKAHHEARSELDSKQNSLDAVESTDEYAGLVYKGRPLNGIWATAPYLHNGSVPNLWQLMQTGSERSKKFWVGSRNFDPENVGFETSQGLNEFSVVDSDGNIMRGNSNLGHEYGTELSDDDKWAIVEYMKTL